MRRVFLQPQRCTDAAAANVLARQFEPSAPNTVWATDITYVWTWKGWLYLVVELWLNRYAVGVSRATFV